MTTRTSTLAAFTLASGEGRRPQHPRQRQLASMCESADGPAVAWILTPRSMAAIRLVFIRRVFISALLIEALVCIVGFAAGVRTA
jgi:hypothetical protein